MVAIKGKLAAFVGKLGDQKSLNCPIPLSQGAALCAASNLPEGIDRKIFLVQPLFLVILDIKPEHDQEQMGGAHMIGRRRHPLHVFSFLLRDAQAALPQAHDAA